MKVIAINKLQDEKIQVANKAVTDKIEETTVCCYACNVLTRNVL